MSQQRPDFERLNATRFHLESSDAKSELVDRSAHEPHVLGEINELMAALGRLRDAERELSRASQLYMRLNETDMRALHFLMVCGNQGVLATPSAIAQHLSISAASTTKLLDRLEAGGHIVRELHPSDRRALIISITPQTRTAAMATVGRQQAKRIHAVISLTSEERATVTKFLDQMAVDLLDGAGEWDNHHSSEASPQDQPAD